MEILLGLLFIYCIAKLGKYALHEGIRIEEQKKFMKDMENFDEKCYCQKKWEENKNTKGVEQ